MFRKLHFKFRGLPTPMAGLALGVASLGWCMENALPLHGFGQLTGAVIVDVFFSVAERTDADEQEHDDDLRD